MKLRQAVRALILDPDDHVLLVRFHFHQPRPTAFWANPGGGIEGTESRLAALQRELREETGLVIDDLGPELWTKTAIFPMDRSDGQVDHIHLVRTDRFEPAPELSPAELAAEHVQEIRWWSPAELASSAETFAPRDLPALLDRLRREGLPESPIELTGF